MYRLNDTALVRVAQRAANLYQVPGFWARGSVCFAT